MKIIIWINYLFIQSQRIVSLFVSRITSNIEYKVRVDVMSSEPNSNACHMFPLCDRFLNINNTSSNGFSIAIETERQEKKNSHFQFITFGIWRHECSVLRYMVTIEYFICIINRKSLPIIMLRQWTLCMYWSICNHVIIQWANNNKMVIQFQCQSKIFIRICLLLFISTVSRITRISLHIDILSLPIESFSLVKSKFHCDCISWNVGS